MRLSQLKAGQLEAYLGSLTPKAAAFLVREVERDKLRGGDAFPHDLILMRIRGMLQEPYDAIVRAASPERIFFAPFEDLLINVSSETKQKGRILRSSADAVWRWLERDLAPDIVARISAECEELVELPDDAVLADRFGSRYAELGRLLHAQLDGFEEGSKDYRHVTANLGSMIAVHDAEELAGCLEVAGRFLKVRARIPAQIKELMASDVPYYVQLHTGFESTCPHKAYLPALSILRRAARLADALKLACEFAGTDDVAQLQAHPVGIVVDALLCDMEIQSDGTSAAIAAQADIEQIEEMLRTFHGLASALEDALVLTPRSKWGARLGAIRARLSGTIKDYISPAPRLVKAALFPRVAKVRGGDEAGHIVPPDPRSVADAEFAVKLLVATRFFLDQLSINAEYSNVKRQVEQFMEPISERILRELRREEADDRAACMQYMEAAGRLTQLFYGEEASHLLLRRGRAAVQTTDEDE